MKSFFSQKGRTLRAWSVQVLLFFTASVAALSTQASVVSVCTAAGGCLPDFNVVSASAAFSSNGSGGTLTINGQGGNISFAVDQVLDALGASFDPVADDKVNGVGAAGDQSNLDDVLGFQIAFGFGPDNSPTGTDNIPESFSLVMDVDANGDITGGSISLIGRVVEGIHGNFLSTARNADNEELEGVLLSGSFTGGQIGGIAFNTANDKIDIGFLGGAVTGGLLDGYSDDFAGSGEIDTFNTTVNAGNYLSTSWTASSVALDIVVPIPASGLLMLSALGGLFGLRRMQ